MVVRFEQYVVHLQPAVVVILAGTNDVAGNTGPMTPEMTMDNFAAMVAIAKANKIKVVIASITPARRLIRGSRSARPAVDAIRDLNVRLKAFLCAGGGWFIWITTRL